MTGISGHTRVTLLLGSLLLAAGLLGGCSDGDDDESGTTSSGAAEPADLGIHPVVTTQTSLDHPVSKEGDILLEDADSGEILELGPAALDASDVDEAEANQPENAVGWVIDLEFTEEGNEKFGDLTEAAGCADPGTPTNRIAIVIDGEMVSAPTVLVECGQRLDGGTQISGDFTKDEAEDLAARINRG